MSSVEDMAEQLASIPTFLASKHQYAFIVPTVFLEKGGLMPNTTSLRLFIRKWGSSRNFSS